MNRILNNQRREGFIKSGFKVLIIRIIAICILMIIYYAIQWNFLRQFLAFSLERIFSYTGNSNIHFLHDDSYNLLVNGNPFILTSNCTYIDLALIIAPLCWRLDQSIRRNLSGIILITCLILFLNVFRIWAAIYFYQSGASWISAHNIPDIFIHLIIITMCTLSALNADL